MHGAVRNHDGVPVAGIVVSNGRDVVATDADGGFTLPDEGAFVVLSRPTGFTANPWWVRAGEQVTFVLEPDEQPLPYSFVHLTDTHMTVPVGAPGRDRVDTLSFGLYAEGSLPDQISSFLSRLPELAPEARSVMITGDLVDHGLPAEYEAYLGAIADSPVPVHLIPGNHDHMVDGDHSMIVSRNNYMTNVGTPDNYERYLGPRWYSFDVAGLHVVAMDWHSHELGLDHEVQNEWVAADLGMLPEGSPWILLFHDQAGASLLDHVPWQPVAAFSGHWHTSRVVDVDGTLHINSPTTFFASLDYSPPAFRRVTWDGEKISLLTQTLIGGEPKAALGDVSRATFAGNARTLSGADVLWRAQLAGGGHRQPVAVAGDRVIAGSQIEDRAAGTVEAFDLSTGQPIWRTDTASAVKTAPAIAGGLAIAAEVSGDVVALDLATGELAWRVPSSDPLRRFGWGAPTQANGCIYVGDQSDLRCIDAETGEVLWRRTDLSPHHNLVQHAAPLIVDDLLVMGFWPTPRDPIGLDALTGETVWITGKADVSATFSAAKIMLIMGTASYDAQTDTVVMPRFSGTTRVARETGEPLWSADHPGRFSPASPLVTSAGYVATVTGQGIRLLERETGESIWELTIEGDAPFPMSSYTKVPHPVIAAPLAMGDDLLLPGLDGIVHRISLAGRHRGEAQLSAPIAAPLVDAGSAVIAVGVDGGILALSAGVAS